MAFQSRALPHYGTIRKCGENQGRSTRPRVWTSATCCFVRKNRGVLDELRFFPVLPKYARKIRCPKAITRQIPFGKQPLKRENRLSAVPTDQARRTVARPHHGPYFKEMHNPGQSPAKILLRTMPGKRASVKLHANL